MESIRIWQNDYKKSDMHPDFKASNVIINGVECDVAVWKSETKDGKPCLSLVASPPYKSKEDRAASKPPPPPPPPEDEEDSLPF